MTQPDRPHASTIDVGEVATAAGAVGAGADGPNAPLLVDVRERDEFLAVRAPGAVLYPNSSFLLRSEELPRDRPLNVICASGSRSAAVAAWLLDNGCSDVHDGCAPSIRPMWPAGPGGLRTTTVAGVPGRVNDGIAVRLRAGPRSWACEAPRSAHRRRAAAIGESRG